MTPKPYIQKPILNSSVIPVKKKKKKSNAHMTAYVTRTRRQSPALTSQKKRLGFAQMVS
jgi:hypothetical protein